jgi:hypothetical protein
VALSASWGLLRIGLSNCGISFDEIKKPGVSHHCFSLPLACSFRRTTATYNRYWKKAHIDIPVGGEDDAENEDPKEQKENIPLEESKVN